MELPPHSMLKATIPVRSEEVRMRPFEKSLWNDRASRFVDEQLDAVWIVHLPRNENVQLVGMTG
ncbi:hypothetical protein SM11_pC0453 (plasmid) [Sinorhizobium meliloti SM11]|uniref:Uncharacterized protein n=1 Tax=Sinorhizobium meliloti (strain SM11) TaxID=707241 RepID=F7XD47_SINMM|nr:hypothetical protein SM11_pC0453 [Sinorhizobium meliloti SM11]